MSTTITPCPACAGAGAGLVAMSPDSPVCPRCLGSGNVFDHDCPTPIVLPAAPAAVWLGIYLARDDGAPSAYYRLRQDEAHELSRLRDGGVSLVDQGPYHVADCPPTLLLAAVGRTRHLPGDTVMVSVELCSALAEAE